VNCHLDVHGSCNLFKKQKVCVYIHGNFLSRCNRHGCLMISIKGEGSKDGSFGRRRASKERKYEHGF
jgi:hypothetical protein